MHNKTTANEIRVYKEIAEANDPISDFTSNFYGTRIEDGVEYCVMDNLLDGFDSPAVMDIKIGKRTFNDSPEIHSERPDLYQKMIQVDPNAPTDSEREAEAITKFRYLSFRDQKSTTSGLCARIEGVSYRDSDMEKPDKKKVLQNISTLDQFIKHLQLYLHNDKTLPGKFHAELLRLKKCVESSPVLTNSEQIGSSLLFVHDSTSGVQSITVNRVGVFLIDFGQTKPIAEGATKNDGYLTGLENLVQIFRLIASTTDK